MATKLAREAERLYAADFYVWAEEQAAHLRARRFDALDLDHLIEEVEGLADAKRSAVLNNARLIGSICSSWPTARHRIPRTSGAPRCASTATGWRPT